MTGRALVVQANAEIDPFEEAIVAAAALGAALARFENALDRLRAAKDKQP